MNWQNDVVLAKRSRLPVILWAVSFAITHLLTSIVPSGGVGIGVAMMFLSAGAAIGMNTNLLLKYQKMQV